jgi:hypothetical protein
MAKPKETLIVASDPKSKALNTWLKYSKKDVPLYFQPDTIRKEQ